MKKKTLIILSFLLIILITAIVFIIAAVKSYNYDMDPANGVDIMEDFEAAMIIIVGGLFILCEIDLFFTVYYFLTKPKTLRKNLFMIISQLMILPVIFSDKLAHFLWEHVSNVFGEEIIVIFPIFLLYVTLRLISIAICFYEKEKEVFY